MFLFQAKFAGFNSALAELINTQVSWKKESKKERTERDKYGWMDR